MTRVNHSRRTAFTLIELIVVIALLLFLMGILMSAVVRVRQAAAGSQCSNNLRQLGLAMHNINDTYKSLPGVVGVFPAGGNTYGTYFYHILPFIEQDNLYKISLPYVWNNQAFSVPIRTYLCPSDPSAPADPRYKDMLATCSYAANWLVFGTGGAAIPRTFADGTSNTIVYTERFQLCRDTPCAWGYPNLYYWAPVFAYYSQGKFQPQPTQAQCDPARPQALHPSGIWVGLGDASVRMVANDISPQTWWYACTPNGGETLGSDW